MASIELYIDNQLCETENPENFSVYLKRQFLNPAELSTKDAQRSYDITLPATATNNAIFGYTNIEEVKGKFLRLYDAQLLVNGIKIFDGKFKLSEITKTTYKGNLGVPAPKTVKDIFGEMMMNQAGEWKIPFKGYDYITKYNKNELPESKYCFFPLALYGLLPKDPPTGIFSPKNILDNTVRLKRDDIPPSINCLETVKHIFEKAGLTISGTAFEDERLTNMFMSYKNPTDYQMQWNYGNLGKISFHGNWTNLRGSKIESSFYTHNGNDNFFITDLFNSSNFRIVEKDDPGHHIKEYKNGDMNNIVIRIPYDGYYKLKFDANLDLNIQGTANRGDGIYIIPAKLTSNKDTSILNFSKCRFEIKVLRQKTDEQIDLRNIGFDNVFCMDNIGQVNDEDYSETKYYPNPGEVNFVDMKQNPYLLCGLSFGRHITDTETYKQWNAIDRGGWNCNPIAKKRGPSWDQNDFLNQMEYVITESAGYYESKNTADGVIFERGNKNKTEIKNTPYENGANHDPEGINGWGKVCQIVWLKKDELITMSTNSDMGVHSFGPLRLNTWVKQNIDFNISLEFLSKDFKWLDINKEGVLQKPVKWDDTPTTMTDQIDLSQFLPAEVKVNDWIENFCKAFNLDLIQKTGKDFLLNTKQIRTFNSLSVIDLDKKTDVNLDRRNNSLMIPSLYKVGFTVDKEEEGYARSLEDEDDINSGNDGGGNYETKSPENKTINQTSFFSYNWLKEITDERDKNKKLLLPVIGNKEVWSDVTIDYLQQQEKKYWNAPQRFWYKKDETFPIILDDNENIEAASIRTDLEGDRPMQLDYKNEENSILRNYFTLLTDAENAYTIVECYINPDEYNRLADSWIKLNGDYYYVAEIDGYDPSYKKKAVLKLIRKQ